MYKHICFIMHVYMYRCICIYIYKYIYMYIFMEIHVEEYIASCHVNILGREGDR